jgi:hypothetical protein
VLPGSPALSDVYEDRSDLVEEREKRRERIGKIQGLDRLILTKRPENIQRLSPYGDE